MTECSEVDKVQLGVSIYSDDDAVRNYPTTETIRMLETMIEAMRNGKMEGALHDVNGNKCGAWKFKIIYYQEGAIKRG